MDFLDDLEKLFGGGTVDSEKQLESARTTASERSPDLDKKAKAAGFKNADEMLLWLKQKNTKRAHESTYDKRQVKEDVSAWHPKVMFDRILEALQTAN